MTRKERLQRLYVQRRSVRPRLTPKQARAVVDYLNRKRETEALGTTLSYALREIERAMKGMDDV